ncbi:methylglutamate dehydrogenase [Microcoleus sp. FACHB-1515]|uniref:methylglutamate dehydrogenase n=1 Tax=Cyanophyceae TaxID=3028117 RepID=UPI001687E9E6|nr:methylglutamate dehydrogenase [Microcoleus sp. FACHB-1515]MBD2090962.1 methylglutamate dehydrogenase [Microcoleus sp. FACHB-1515]
MKTPIRLSPIFDRLQSVKGNWREINGMPCLTRVEENYPALEIADLSCLTRCGFKGAGAADWLRDQGLPVPDRPNSWLSLPEGGIIARLGISEFLIEDSLESNVSARLSCQSVPARVYPVLRQDLAIALCGNSIDELLRQTCNVNFGALSLAETPVVLTSMIGVAVTIIPGAETYRIWCDGTFGAYFWQTLLEIAAEMGGGVVGIDRFFQSNF